MEKIIHLTDFVDCQYYRPVEAVFWLNRMNTIKDRGPGVCLPPPIIFIVAMGLGYLFERLYPLAKLNSYFWLLIGSTGIILCVGVLGYAAFTFKNARTHIEPWRPATSLITTGLYSISRNPIYLTFIIFNVCLGLVLSNLWIVIFTVPAIWILKTYVISKEEAYLEATFLDKYITYKRKVRRWL